MCCTSCPSDVKPGHDVAFLGVLTLVELLRSSHTDNDVDNMVADNSDDDTDSTRYSDITSNTDNVQYSDATSDTHKEDHTPASERGVSVLRAQLRALLRQRPAQFPNQSEQASRWMHEVQTRFLEDHNPSFIESCALRRFPLLTAGMRAKLRLRLAYESGRIKRIPPSLLDVSNVMARDMSERERRDFRVRFVHPAAQFAYRLPWFLEDYLEFRLPPLRARIDSANASHIYIG
ncbi:hypothetical protein RhiJN_16679 [Ceratobasidium sp. AG-Ba]|nr:hypothetical protein RhiJN_16679 [Ceratobasidium sp. AG-Ba]